MPDPERGFLPAVVAGLRRAARVAGAVAGLPAFLFHLLTRRRRPDDPEPVVCLCDLILQQSLEMGAQELHVLAAVLPLHERPDWKEVGRLPIAVRVYHHGAWKDLLRLPGFVHAPLLNRLKLMAHLDVATHDKQEGQVHVTVRGREAALGLTIQTRPDGTEEAHVRFPEPAGAQAP